VGDVHVPWCRCGKQKFGLLGLVWPSDGEEKGVGKCVFGLIAVQVLDFVYFFIFNIIIGCAL